MTTALPGSSELATIVGVPRRRRDGTPYLSELELWARCRGLLPRYDSESSPDADAGNDMQAGVGLRWSKLHGGVTVLPGPSIEQPGVGHPDVPWTTRPDFLVPGMRTVLEIKAPRELDGDEWGPDDTDQAPPYYVVQVVAQLAVCRRLGDYERAELFARARAARWGDRVQASYQFALDERREARIVAKVRQWVRQHLEDGVPPAPDGSPSAGTALARMFRPKDVEIVATDDDVRRWSRLLQLRGARDDIEARVRAEEQAVMARMAEHTALVHNGRRLVTWRPRAGSSRIDLSRLRRERPDIAQQFAVNSEPTRTFRVEQEA